MMSRAYSAFLRPGLRSRLAAAPALALALALTAWTAPLVAQQPLPAVLGTPVLPPPPPAAENAASGTGGFGLSGAVRVAIAEAGGPLSRAQLWWGGEGWEWGHRWVPINPGSWSLASDVGYVGDGYLVSEVVAPRRAGIWRLENTAGASITVITPVPASAQRGTHLNGYHIGIYPSAAVGRNDAYAAPSGFIEVTPENRDLPISDHLTLGQFITRDQTNVWPKYVALDLRLIDKLELVIQELRSMGVHAERIHVMSGFRTPQYNGPGGDGRAALSRHMWGDAADVWIDNLGDGRMDDLNGDGRIDIDDAAVIMRAVERVERKHPDLVGGAGTYPSRDARGPYIHIDARGDHSRW